MKIKATVVRLGAFGLSKDLVYITGFSRRDYAQHRNVLSYDFVEKGKRTGYRRHLTTNEPHVILGGWLESLEVPSGRTEEEISNTGLIVARSRFSSFAPEYRAEAEAFREKLYTMNLPILLDATTPYVASELCSSEAAHA